MASTTPYPHNKNAKTGGGGVAKAVVSIPSVSTTPYPHKNPVVPGVSTSSAPKPTGAAKTIIDDVHLALKNATNGKKSGGGGSSTLQKIQKADGGSLSDAASTSKDVLKSAASVAKTDAKEASKGVAVAASAVKTQIKILSSLQPGTAAAKAAVATTMAELTEKEQELAVSKAAGKFQPIDERKTKADLVMQTGIQNLRKNIAEKKKVVKDSEKLEAAANHHVKVAQNDLQTAHKQSAAADSTAAALRTSAKSAGAVVTAAAAADQGLQAVADAKEAVKIAAKQKKVAEKESSGDELAKAKALAEAKAAAAAAAAAVSKAAAAQKLIQEQKDAAAAAAAAEEVKNKRAVEEQEKKKAAAVLVAKNAEREAARTKLIETEVLKRVEAAADRLKQKNTAAAAAELRATTTAAAAAKDKDAEATELAKAAREKANKAQVTARAVDKEQAEAAAHLKEVRASRKLALSKVEEAEAVVKKFEARGRLEQAKAAADTLNAAKVEKLLTFAGTGAVQQEKKGSVKAEEMDALAAMAPAAKELQEHERMLEKDKKTGGRVPQRVVGAGLPAAPPKFASEPPPPATFYDMD